MKGKKFFSSHGIAIYVHDILTRYQAGALCYPISAAGPEASDVDFMQVEFLHRTNGKFVVDWGNLVNRATSVIVKKFGEIPTPDPLRGIDQVLLDEVDAGFDTVNDLIRHHRQKTALAGAICLIGEASGYVTEAAPSGPKVPEECECLVTVLHTLAQAVTNLSLMLSPSLPHVANDINTIIDGQGKIAPMLRIEEVEELNPEVLPAILGGRSGYPTITGDYTHALAWEHHEIEVDTPIAKPTPVFVKLDESIVEGGLTRYADSVLNDVTGA